MDATRTLVFLMLNIVCKPSASHDYCTVFIEGMFWGHSYVTSSQIWMNLGQSVFARNDPVHVPIGTQLALKAIDIFKSSTSSLHKHRRDIVYDTCSNSYSWSLNMLNRLFPQPQLNTYLCQVRGWFNSLFRSLPNGSLCAKAMLLLNFFWSTIHNLIIADLWMKMAICCPWRKRHRHYDDIDDQDTSLNRRGPTETSSLLKNG